MKNNYLEQYETTLARISAEENNLSRWTTQKRQLQQNAATADQIVAVEAQITSSTGRLTQLRSQSREYAAQLQELARQDTQLLEALSKLETEYGQTIAQTEQYIGLYQGIMTTLNNYSEKEGLELNQTEFITAVLPPEELVRSDVLKNACKLKHIEGFDQALDKITDINFQDTEGKTILMHALSNGFYYGVDKLLARGADVNLLDKEGHNALDYACTWPHIKYVTEILAMTENITPQILEPGNGAMHCLINNDKVIYIREYCSHGELNTLYLSNANIRADAAEYIPPLANNLGLVHKPQGEEIKTNLLAKLQAILHAHGITEAFAIDAYQEYFVQHSGSSSHHDIAQAHICLARTAHAEAIDNPGTNIGYDVAIAHYVQALTHEAATPAIYNELGSLFAGIGDYAKAIECYGVANNAYCIKECFKAWLAADATDLSIWLKLGDYHASIGQSQKAVEYYHNACGLSRGQEFKERALHKVADALRSRNKLADQLETQASAHEFYSFETAGEEFFTSLLGTSDEGECYLG